MTGLGEGKANEIMFPFHRKIIEARIAACAKVINSDPQFRRLDKEFDSIPDDEKAEIVTALHAKIRTALLPLHYHGKTAIYYADDEKKAAAEQASTKEFYEMAELAVPLGSAAEKEEGAFTADDAVALDREKPTIRSLTQLRNISSPKELATSLCCDFLLNDFSFPNWDNISFPTDRITSIETGVAADNAALHRALHQLPDPKILQDKKRRVAKQLIFHLPRIDDYVNAALEQLTPPDLLYRLCSVTGFLNILSSGLSQAEAPKLMMQYEGEFILQALAERIQGRGPTTES